MRSNLLNRRYEFLLRNRADTVQWSSSQFSVLQIPYEVCELVPDVECVNVLKRVPELQCTPEIFEDCNDVEKKVPYLVPEEDCVEITFDECQEVNEQ